MGSQTISSEDKLHRGPIAGMASDLIQAALGYVRWSQMVPMLLAWTFVLLGVCGALLIGFQQESFVVLGWLHEQASRVPGLVQWLDRSLEASGAITEDGGIHLTDEIIGPWVIQAWAVASVVLLATLVAIGVIVIALGLRAREKHFTLVKQCSLPGSWHWCYLLLRLTALPSPILSLRCKGGLIRRDRCRWNSPVRSLERVCGYLVRHAANWLFGADQRRVKREPPLGTA